MKKTTSSLVALLLIMSSPLQADIRSEYFDRQESQRFGTAAERRQESTNWLDNAPTIHITQFDFSQLTELALYGIDLSELEAIAMAHLKARKGRYQIDQLNHLTTELTRYLQSQGLLLSRIYIPAQQLANPTLQLAVARGDLESVQVHHNELYSQRIIEKPFQLQTGKPINRNILDTAVLHLQQFPGYTYSATFAPGEQPGATSIQIRTTEERRIQGSLGGDNYGSDYTGKQRLQGNLHINNLTGNADQLSLGGLYTINPNNSLYGNIGYRRPYFGSFSGKGGYMEATYSQNTYAIGQALEKLNLKGEANNLAFTLTQNLKYQAHEQLIARLQLNMKTARLKAQDITLSEDRITTLNAGLHWNTSDTLFGIPTRSQLSSTIVQGLSGILNAQDNGTPNSRINTRGEFGARDFTKLDIQASRLHYLNSTELKFSAQGIYTDDMLAPIEQTPLGGPYAVRGYTTSDFNTDKALILSLEYIGYSASRLSLPIDQLKAAAFFDYGAGWRNQALANEKPKTDLMAIGWYAEFIKDKKFNAKTQMGYPLSSTKPANGNRIQWYLSLHRSF